MDKHCAKDIPNSDPFGTLHAIYMLLNYDPVFWIQPGEIKLHELAGIEAVLVRVEGYDAAELQFIIPASPLEPLPPGCRIRLLPVPGY